MKFRIEHKEKFVVTVFSKEINTKEENPQAVIPKFWGEVMENGRFQKLEEESRKISSEMLSVGICYDMEVKPDTFKYAIGIVGEVKNLSDDLHLMEIPGSTWAIFESIGKLPGAIQQVWQDIFNSWFPTSEYVHARGPELEVYLPGDTDSEDYICEVWIPVVKK